MIQQIYTTQSDKQQNPQSPVKSEIILNTDYALQRKYVLFQTANNLY